MYEELVKRLRNRANGSYEEKCEGCEFTEDFPPCVHCTIKAFNDAANAIEELSKLRWIPVTERLPEEDGDYLVWFYNAKCWKVAEFNKHTAKGCHVWWFAGIDGTRFVTHWMPLPLPPKEETE